MNGTEGDLKHGDAPAAPKETAPIPSKPPPTTNLEDLTTRALRFLSTATPETIGGIAVGLVACTYLVLGKVGLVLIGVLGGIVLHATWEGRSPTASSNEDLRKEKGLDIVKRLLDLRETRTIEKDEQEEKEILGNSFEGFEPETGAALNELVEAVIRGMPTVAKLLVMGTFIDNSQTT
jgi:hypothetical protein